MTKEQVDEFKELIELALKNSQQAAENGDMETAQFFAGEATDLLVYLQAPEAKLLH